MLRFFAVLACHRKSGAHCWQNIPRDCASECVCVGECHWFFLHVQMRKFCCSWVDDAMSKVHEMCMILISDCMRCRPGHCKANEFQVSLSTSLYRYDVWITLSSCYTYMHAYIIKQNHLRIIAILWFRCLESSLHSWITRKFSSQVSPLWIPRPPRIFCRWLTCPTSWACWSETWRKKQTNSCTNTLLVNQWIYPKEKQGWETWHITMKTTRLSKCILHLGSAHAGTTDGTCGSDMDADTICYDIVIDIRIH